MLLVMIINVSSSVFQLFATRASLIIPKYMYENKNTFMSIYASVFYGLSCDLKSAIANSQYAVDIHTTLR